MTWVNVYFFIEFVRHRRIYNNIKFGSINSQLDLSPVVFLFTKMQPKKSIIQAYKKKTKGLPSCSVTQVKAYYLFFVIRTAKFRCSNNKIRLNVHLCYRITKQKKFKIVSESHVLWHQAGIKKYGTSKASREYFVI